MDIMSVLYVLVVSVGAVPDGQDVVGQVTVRFPVPSCDRKNVSVCPALAPVYVNVVEVVSVTL